MTRDEYRNLMAGDDEELIIDGIGKLINSFGDKIDVAVQQATMAMDLALEFETRFELRHKHGEEIIPMDEIKKLASQCSSLLSQLQTLSVNCDKTWLNQRTIKREFWRPA